MSGKNKLFRRSVLLLSGPALLASFLVLAPAQVSARSGGDRPALVITNDPLPESLRKKIYSKPVRVPEIGLHDITGGDYYSPTDTMVGRKVGELQEDLRSLKSAVIGISGTLVSLERAGEVKSAQYYANVATINTQLQSGTTPGNPRLVRKIAEAETSLEGLAGDVLRLNELAVNTARIASEASFLMETARASYSLSGAVEEDHVGLAQLEDSINGALVVIERVLNNVNDDITRTSAYLSSERNNLRILSLAVTNGDLYGKSLANRPFSSVSPFEVAGHEPSSGSAGRAPLSDARPLVKIRFDRQDVAYEQPVYMAVNEALERYPQASFELVAVNPTQGNAAQVAIESTRARRNAERVLRTLTQMGLPLNRVNLSYVDDAQAQTSEVHLYIR